MSHPHYHPWLTKRANEPTEDHPGGPAMIGDVVALAAGSYWDEIGAVDAIHSDGSVTLTTGRKILVAGLILIRRSQ